MGAIDELFLKLRREEVVGAKQAKDVYKWLSRWNMPTGGPLRKLFGGLYRAHEGYEATAEFLKGKFLYEPMVKSRFHSVGEGLQLTALPYIKGHAKITVGDGCRFGYLSISSGRFVDEPELIIGNNVSIGTNVRFIVNKRVTIGNNVGIAGHCWIADSDGHPTDLERREKGETLLSPDEIHPLTIEDFAWIGHGAKIMKGVTVGRGSVVAAGSVVASDVPPGGLAMGVPARMLKKPW